MCFGHKIVNVAILRIYIYTWYLKCIILYIYMKSRKVFQKLMFTCSSGYKFPFICMRCGWRCSGGKNERWSAVYTTCIIIIVVVVVSSSSFSRCASHHRVSFWRSCRLFSGITITYSHGFRAVYIYVCVIYIGRTFLRRGKKPATVLRIYIIL